MLPIVVAVRTAKYYSVSRGLFNSLPLPPWQVRLVSAEPTSPLRTAMISLQFTTIPGVLGTHALFLKDCASLNYQSNVSTSSITVRS